MEETKKKGYGFHKGGEERGLCEIKFSISRCHIENPCSLKGRKLHFFDFVPNH